jgi:hypothetical protein
MRREVGEMLLEDGKYFLLIDIVMRQSIQACAEAVAAQEQAVLPRRFAYQCNLG